MALDRTGYGITSSEHPTITCAVSKSDDYFRIWRGLVHVLQRPLHIHCHWTSHHERISVARGRGNVDAESFRIIDRIHQCVHLHLAPVAGARVNLADGQGAT